MHRWAATSRVERSIGNTAVSAQVPTTHSHTAQISAENGGRELTLRN